MEENGPTHNLSKERSFQLKNTYLGTIGKDDLPTYICTSQCPHIGKLKYRKSVERSHFSFQLASQKISFSQKITDWFMHDVSSFKWKMSNSCDL